MAASILTTKLHIPASRRGLVPRPRLLDRLDEGLRRRLVLVSAPAGFGKTTLLAEWLGGLAGDADAPKVAWLSLDEGDSDPARFAAYLAAALARADGDLGAAGAAPATGAWLGESHLVPLLNRVADLAQTFILVLDDYHLITSQSIHEAVGFVLEHAPPNLHLVLATRADPPLPLPRLRARGQLVELRQSDLRFTADEAATFLQSVAGLALSAADVAALEARTEGWIAGLQMAALAMQRSGASRAPASGFVQALTGSHRFILDYLVEEVLEQQPSEVQHFLLCTSILDRLCAPLCDALLVACWPAMLGQQASGILEHLDRANLFIVPLDDERRWYRYHRLFSDLLRKRLGQTWPERLPALHRRASAWHEQAGHAAEAIEHALAGRDFQRAAGLVEGAAEATLMRSEVATFLGWVERLPAGALRQRPGLCFFHAWTLLMSGRSLAAVEGTLQNAAGLDRDAAPAAGQGVGALAGGLEGMPGRMAALRAYLMLFQADTERAAALCRQALERLPEEDVFVRSVVAWILSIARLGDLDPRDGGQALEEVAARSQEMGNRFIAVAALCHCATLQMRQGRLPRARETLARALDLATDAGRRRLPVAGKALIGLAELDLEWNDLDAAAGHLAEGIDLARRWSEMAAFDACIPQMRLCLARGDVEGARETIETARQIARRSEATEIDDLVADLQQAYFFLAQGDAAGVRRWAEGRGLLSGTAREPGPARDADHDFVSARLRKYEHLMLARFFVLQGQAAEALDLLDSLLDTARHLARTDLIIQIQIQRALAFGQQGGDDRAVEALAEALLLAEPGGYLRIFLDGGPPLARLLHRVASRGLAPDYAPRLLAAFDPTQKLAAQQLAPQATPAGAPPATGAAHPLVEPLSDRELEVLRLLAAGLSNPEIADELVVAVSTVRSHCKSIYGKLGVHSRWDAVQRGQALGLLG